MRHARAWGTAFVLSLALPGVVSAQTPGTRLSEAPPPAEFPPASFRGPEYVDSAGCLYVRGGEGATSVWVPRVTANRMAICGLKPTVSRSGMTEAPLIGEGSAAPHGAVRSAPATTPTPAGRYVPPTVTLRAVASPLRQVARVPRVMPRMPAAPEQVSVHQAGQQAVAGTLDGGTAIVVPAPPRIEVPNGYRPAWQDGRLNPYAGKQLLSGALQQALIWTQTVPRRLKNQSGEDMTSRYHFLVYPYTDYGSQRAALESGNYIIIETTAGREIVPRY